MSADGWIMFALAVAVIVRHQIVVRRLNAQLANLRGDQFAMEIRDQMRANKDREAFKLLHEEMRLTGRDALTILRERGHPRTWPENRP